MLHILKALAIAASLCQLSMAEDETVMLQVGQTVNLGNDRTDKEEKPLEEQAALKMKRAAEEKREKELEQDTEPLSLLQTSEVTEKQMPQDLPPMYDQQRPPMYAEQMPPMYGQPMPPMYGHPMPPMYGEQMPGQPMPPMYGEQMPPMYDQQMGPPAMPPAEMQMQPPVDFESGAMGEQAGPPWRSHRRRYMGYGAYGNPDYEYDRDRGYEDAGTGIYRPGGYVAPGYTPWMGWGGYGYGGYGYGTYGAPPECLSQCGSFVGQDRTACMLDCRDQAYAGYAQKSNAAAAVGIQRRNMMAARMAYGYR